MTDKNTHTNPARQVRTNSIGWMLSRITKNQHIALVAKLKPINLVLNEFIILMTLMEHEGLTQSQIGAQVSLPAYSTSRAIDALVEKGMVERRNDVRSRRSYQIHLTQSGWKIGPQIFAIVNEVNRQLLTKLSKDEKLFLTAILRKLT